ncbi:MAG: hypothetical protein KVP17_003085 [Porospora cf. gigantea B]|nr:MAG: hypothetical protein KVP17_003085 [Porospora cf. gigantea B]
MGLFFGLLTPVSHAKSIVDGLLVDAPSYSVVERAGAKMQADLRTFPATRLDCCVHAVIPTASSLPLLECVSVNVRSPFCSVPRQTPDSPEILLETYLTSLYIRVSTTVLNRPDPNLDIMPLALNSVPVTDTATWSSLRQSIISALCNPVVATKRHEAVDDIKPGTVLGLPIAGTIQALAYEESSLTRVDVAVNLGIDAKSDSEESVPYPPLVPLHMNSCPNTAFLLCLVGGALCMFQVATTYIPRGETIHAPQLEHIIRGEPNPRFATVHFYTDGCLPINIPLDAPPPPPVVIAGSKEWHMEVSEHRLDDLRRFLRSIGKRYNFPFDCRAKPTLWNYITIAFIKLSEKK